MSSEQSSSSSSTSSSSSSSPSSFSSKLNASAKDKDELRVLRLRRSNSVKERLDTEYQKICLKDCDMDIKRYWVCRQENGLLTPLYCTAENTQMNACLKDCSKNEAKRGAFNSQRMAEFETNLLATKSTTEKGQ